MEYNVKQVTLVHNSSALLGPFKNINNNISAAIEDVVKTTSVLLSLE